MYNSTAVSPTELKTSADAVVERGSPTHRVLLGSQVAQSMVVQMCLGGPTMNAQFNDTKRLLQTLSLLEPLLPPIQTEALQMLGVLS